MTPVRVAMVPAGDRPAQDPSVRRLPGSLADLGVEVRRPTTTGRTGGEAA